jgi:alkyl hydroperoxide reductase subunit AhpF
VGLPVPLGTRHLDLVSELDLSSRAILPGMPLLDAAVRGELREVFAGLVSPVRLVVFSQALAEPVSEEVRRIVEELAELEPKISAESRNFVLDKERVAELGIERIPAIAVLGEQRDYGVRFYGLPTGYEFGTLVDAIVDVSVGDSGLAPETREALAGLESDVRIRVFSTPT